MAECILIKTGSGYSSSDVTVTRNDIPLGMTALTADSNNLIVEGTLKLSGNALPENVLEGNTFYNNDLHEQVVGTMPDLSGTNQNSEGIWSDNNYAYAPIRTKGFYSEDTTVRIPLPEFGDVISSKVLQGFKFTSKSGVALEGSMINQGDVFKDVDPMITDTVVIPAGYNNGGIVHFDFSVLEEALASI